MGPDDTLQDGLLTQLLVEAFHSSPSVIYRASCLSVLHDMKAYFPSEQLKPGRGEGKRENEESRNDFS